MNLQYVLTSYSALILAYTLTFYSGILSGNKNPKKKKKKKNLRI